MARSISTIQAQLTSTLQAQLAAINITIDPTTWSSTNILRLLCYVFAFCANALEQIFDAFVAYVQSYIANMKGGTMLWYGNMAKAFQYGFDLLPDSDQFNNTGYTDDQIAASKIVSYATAVLQTDTFGRLSVRLKVAGIANGDLAPLSTPQITALTEYFGIVGYPVALTIDSQQPDSLKTNWTIYYDPLILDNAGNRLDGTATDLIATAIKNYLLNLPFSGTFALELIQQTVKKIDGVVLANIDLAQSQFGNYDFTNIATFIVPDAGYLRFAEPTDLQITYLPHTPI